MDILNCPTDNNITTFQSINNEDVKLNLKFEKNHSNRIFYSSLSQNIVLDNKYKLIYPSYRHAYKLSSSFLMGQNTILLYQSPTTYILKWYPLIFDNHNKIKFDKSILIISTFFACVESLLLFCKHNELKKPNIHFLSINYFYNSDTFIRKSEEIKKFIDRTYGNVIYMNDKFGKLYDPKIFNQAIKSTKKHMTIFIDIVFTFQLVKQILFASILLSLHALNNQGTLIFLLSVNKFDRGYFKEIIYLLKKYFNKLHLYRNPVRPLDMFVIFEHYNGINKKDAGNLFYILEQWYGWDGSGGKMLRYSNEEKYKYNEKFDKSKHTDIFIKSLFDFKYNDDYNKEFQEIVENSENIKECLTKYINKSKKYNIDWTSDEIKKFLSSYTTIDLKRNIEMAKKYALPVHPKYLDYDREIEKEVLEDLYAIDRIIVHTFAKYKNRCDIDVDKIKNNTCSFKIKNLESKKKLLNIYKFAIDTRYSKRWNNTMHFINLGFEIKKYVSRKYDIPNVTRGFLKMYEMLSNFPELVQTNDNILNSVHVCEAPGKFIMALTHYVKTKTNIKSFNWNGNSLNPYNEENNKKYGRSLIKDQYGFIKNNKSSWLWGHDNTGDITKVKNIKHIVSSAKKNLGNNITFFTSDCGLDVSEDYNNQELILSILNLAQVILSLLILAEHGNSVIKIFLPMTECITMSLIYLLYCSFGKVSIVKPITSSPLNSEVYIVCQDYINIIDDKMESYLLNFLNSYKKGNSLFPKQIIPEEFLYQYEHFVKNFIKRQLKALIRSFYYYDYQQILNNHRDKISTYKVNRAKQWVKIVNITQSSDKRF